MTKALNGVALSHHKLTTLTKVFLASLLIAVSAQISIPFYPVPMTLQPECVLLVGLLSSPRTALAITTTYVLEALLGLPVLQGFSGGVSSAFGPTGGYIFGFVLMAFFASILKDKMPSKVGFFMAGFAGYTALLFSGFIWLSFFVGFEKALTLGVLPFLLKAAFSTALVGVFSSKLLRLNGSLYAR